MPMASSPAPEAEGRPSAFLQHPDTATPLPPTAGAAFWTKQLARLPFLHSVFWVLFFVAVALLGVPDNSVDSVLGLPPIPPQTLPLSWAYIFMYRLATAWMLYGLFKFVSTAIACFAGIYQVQKCLAVTDWHARSTAAAPALLRAEEDARAKAAAESTTADTADGSKCGRPSYDVVSTTAADDHEEVLPPLLPPLYVPYEEVVHLVVIPNCCEPAEVLAATLDTLQAQTAAKSLVVVLAFEGRDPDAHAKAAQLLAAYSGSFQMMLYTSHVLSQGEVGGKSSNENWAVRCAKKHLVDELGVPSSRVVVTTCDADTYFHPQHFACLAYHFSTDPHKYERFWQPATCFYPNLHEVPALCRARYTLISVGFLGQLANPLVLSLPFSCYSLSLDLATKACFWDPTVIPEDWHMWLRCFYASQGAIQVTPLWLPLGSECVVTPSLEAEEEKEEEEDVKAVKVFSTTTTTAVGGAVAATVLDPTTKTQQMNHSGSFRASSSAPTASPRPRGVLAQMLGPAWMKSAEDFGACYKQSRRWQWGAIDVGFILVHNAITPHRSPRPQQKANSHSALASSSSLVTATRAGTGATYTAGNNAPTATAAACELEEKETSARAAASEAAASDEAAAAARRFVYEKGRVLFTAYEHHLLANVMWCALLLAPFVFRTSWSSWHYHMWLSFLFMNWAFLTVLDTSYRTLLIQDRDCFQEATAHCPSSKSRKLQASVQAVIRSLGTRAALKRSLDLALFPLADLLLFVAPTFHAHATMAINADSFVYEVAPKGGNSNSSLSLSSLASSSSSSSSSTQDLQQEQDKSSHHQKLSKQPLVQLPSLSLLGTPGANNATSTSMVHARDGELSPLLSSVPVQPTAQVGSYGSNSNSNHNKNHGSMQVEEAATAAAVIPAKPVTVRVVA